MIISPIRQDIMNLRPEERLDYAIDLIDLISGWDQVAFQYFRSLGIAPQGSRTACLLNANPGQWMSREQIATVIHGPLYESDTAVVTSICRIRAIIPNWIGTRYGSGYTANYKIDTS